MEEQHLKFSAALYRHTPACPARLRYHPRVFGLRHYSADSLQAGSALLMLTVSQSNSTEPHQVC